MCEEGPWPSSPPCCSRPASWRFPAERRLRAAFPGQPWQTNFEIEPFPTANTTVQGPTPPAGGAGIDWDNAASFIQDFGNPTEACGPGVDPTTISGKLDDFNVFAPNPVPGLVLNKGDICQAFSGWEVVNVTTAPGATELHYILYGGWRRDPGRGRDLGLLPVDRRSDARPRSR